MGVMLLTLLMSVWRCTCSTWCRVAGISFARAWLCDYSQVMWLH